MPVPLGTAFRVWARIGCLSFGGPAGQIALMHREIIDERKWLEEKEYLNALSLCMLLPGPEAMQLATYVGWRMHGVLGGLMSGLLFVLPGAAVMLALAAVYALYGQLPLVEALFYGIKAAVLVIVVEALIRIGRRALKQRTHWLIAGLSFIAIFVLELPYPLIVVVAGAAGYLATAVSPPIAAPVSGGGERPRTLATIIAWLAIWLLPLLALLFALGPAHVLAQLAGLFSILAVVTFGGAYAVLAYLAQAAVETFGWMRPGEMLDGLGLAETTPGPLILVTELVGFLAAARSGGSVSLGMGVAGAIVTLWATFAPCFLWIFAAGPYVVRLARAPRLQGALQAITAAVVGVVLNLSLWFALHVWAPGITELHFGPLRWWTLPAAGFDVAAVALSLVSALLLLVLHQGMARTLALAAALGLVWKLAI